MVHRKFAACGGESRRSFAALYHTDGYAAAGVEIKVVDDARKLYRQVAKVKKPRVAPMCLWVF